MTTPQPTKSVAPQQGKTPQYAAATPGGSASTPANSNLHVAFSPHGPRSSPQHIKKSPANVGPGGIMMAAGNSSSGQPGGGVSAPMNFDSPSAAAFNNMLGVGAFDPSLDTMGMGMGALGMPRQNDDVERQKKLDEIVRILSKKKGIVSEEGLERLVKRIGLDVLWEQKNNLKNLAIAGTTFTLDIGMKDHEVQTVDLQYAYSSEEVKSHKADAEAILLDNLKLRPGQMHWTKQLDDFASNLEPLALQDKLSIVDDKGTPILIAYDAPMGIFESLKKVHERDVKDYRDNPTYHGKPEKYIRTIAMCEQHGRPWVHEKGIVGVGLEYWRDQRYHNPPPEVAKEWYDNGQDWSITLSCARRDPMVFASAVRSSNQWIGDEVEVTIPESPVPMLNWQQPPEIMLPDKPGDELLSLVGQRTPEVMLTAVLNPPVTLPITVWGYIHEYTGASTPPTFNMQTYDYLVFPADGNYNPTEPRMVQNFKKVNTRNKDGTSRPIAHANRLFIHKPVYAQTLSELPFSHPSQLVDLLPTLRQYAFLWNLLDKSFGSQAKAPPEEAATVDGNETVTAKADDFATFMRDAAADQFEPAPNATVKVDVTLALMTPNPTLQILFPFRGRPAQVSLDIGRNGVVTMNSTNLVNDEGQLLDDRGEPEPGSLPNSKFSKNRLARLLMFWEDIDRWCEFIRVSFGPE